MAAAKATLEAEEEALLAAKAIDNAAVHWLVVDQLANIVTPVFAMGPARTLMRSLSAFISDEKPESETDILFG